MGNPLKYDNGVVEHIRMLWATGGHTYLSIAQVVGLTRNQVAGQIDRMRSLEGDDRWHRKLPGKRTARTSFSRRGKTLKPIKSGSVVNKAKEIREVTLASKATHSSLKCDPVSFVDRELSRCAFPLDDNIGPEMQMCGARTEIGYSWCSHHRRIVFPGNFKASGKGFRLSKIGAAA